MDFSVFTPDEVEYFYHDDATFKVLDGGALHVWPREADRREKQVIYGPAGWLRVEVMSEAVPPPAPMRIR